MTLKLFGHDPSPFVRRVRILLAELGIPFERDTNNWITPTAEFAAASPIMRLPMLDRGEGARTRYVYDSRVIAEVAYEVARGTTPLAGEPKVQATLWNAALEDEDKNVLSTIDAALESAVNVFLLERDGIGSTQAPYLARQAARVDACLAWLEARYAGRATLSPGALAFVDMALVSMVGWLRFRARADVARYPALLAVEAAHAARPTFSSTIPG